MAEEATTRQCLTDAVGKGGLGAVAGAGLGKLLSDELRVTEPRIRGLAIIGGAAIGFALGAFSGLAPCIGRDGGGGGEGAGGGQGMGGTGGGPG